MGNNTRNEVIWVWLRQQNSWQQSMPWFGQISRTVNETCTWLLIYSARGLVWSGRGEEGVPLQWKWMRCLYCNPQAEIEAAVCSYPPEIGWSASLQPPQTFCWGFLLHHYGWQRQAFLSRSVAGQHPAHMGNVCFCIGQLHWLTLFAGSFLLPPWTRLILQPPYPGFGWCHINEHKLGTSTQVWAFLCISYFFPASPLSMSLWTCKISSSDETL